MSSTNKSWWVIWNAKRLPNMTQNSREETISLAFLAVSFVFTVGLKKNKQLQAWNPKTQILNVTQSWIANLRKSLWLKVLVDWWQLDRFVEIYGLAWMELTGGLRGPIPGQTDTGLQPYLTTAAVCSNLTSPDNARLLRRPAWSNFRSNEQMLSFVDINIYPTWPQAIKTDEFSEKF